MQITIKQKGMALLSLIFMFAMLWVTFENKNVFWYLYSFTILVCIAIAIVNAKFFDELPTWRYLLFGIGYGTISYAIIRLGYMLGPILHIKMIKPVNKFLEQYGPAHIGHYLLLIFIIIIGEELFWRGYIQQFLKNYMRPALAVVTTALLCAASLWVSGFIPGVLAAFTVSILWGFLYEWKKSMPLIIVAHAVFILLLFLVLPLG